MFHWVCWSWCLVTYCEAVSEFALWCFGVRALVRGRGIVFRYFYNIIEKCAGKDLRDGAVVPFE